jgi:hypothetical protein
MHYEDGPSGGYRRLTNDKIFEYPEDGISLVDSVQSVLDKGLVPVVGFLTDTASF